MRRMRAWCADAARLEAAHTLRAQVARLVRQHPCAWVLRLFFFNLRAQLARLGLASELALRAQVARLEAVLRLRAQVARLVRSLHCAWCMLFLSFFLMYAQPAI